MRPSIPVTRSDVGSRSAAAEFPRCYIARSEPDDVAGAIDRGKRLKRRGWTVTLLQEIRTGELITLGVLESDAEPEPDRRGQFELPIDT